MGYFIKKISKNPDNKAAKVSLAGNPNFIQFESLGQTEAEPITMKILTPAYEISGGRAVVHGSFEITEKVTGNVHKFYAHQPPLSRAMTAAANNDTVTVYETTSASTISGTAAQIVSVFNRHIFLGQKFNASISPADDSLIMLDPKPGATAYHFAIASLSTTGKDFYLMGGNYDGVAPGEDLPVDTKLHIVGNGIYQQQTYDENNQPIVSFVNIAKFTVTETKTGKEHAFEGTGNADNIGGNNFYIGKLSPSGTTPWNKYRVAESLKDCLQDNEFFGAKFDITLPPETDANGMLTSGSSIHLRSKGSGEEYAFEMKVGENVNETHFREAFFTIPRNTGISYSGDTISEGNSPVEIQIELYKDPQLFLGRDGKPDTPEKMGTYVTTLSKAYFNQPLWFNINVLDSKPYATDFLLDGYKNTWFDTGTANSFRYVAKRFTDNSENYGKDTFYYSDVFYTLAGYDRTLEHNDLSPYIFDIYRNNAANPVKPLTTQPALFHVKGQKQFFNFILSDSDTSNNTGDSNFEIAITYKLYTQSQRFIEEVRTHTKNKNSLNIVNTIVLDIDGIIADKKNVGIVEAALSVSRQGSPVPQIVSHPLTFRILPQCLHKVNDFAFLNRLGGWSSFNFATTEGNEFKATANTFYKTHQPAFGKSAQLESVYNKQVEEKFSVQTMPVTREVAEWLKEMSASRAVYELATGRYVIVEELTIKPNSKDDLFRLEMKYRYSDSYN